MAHKFNLFYPTSRTPSEERDRYYSSANALPDEEIWLSEADVGHFVYTCMISLLASTIIGLGSGLVKRKSFKDSLAEGESLGDWYAIFFGVDSSVNHFLKKLRGKHDAINAGISGCVTGLVMNVSGSPQALLQGCVGWGAFGYVLEAFVKHRKANGLPLSRILRQLDEHHKANGLPLSRILR